MKPAVGATYSFKDITKALSDLDHHKADGKIVVSV